MDTAVLSYASGVSAARCPVEVMKRVAGEMHMGEVAICYGMTETSPVSTMTDRDDGLARRTATVGRVMPHLEVKVVDPGDRPGVAPRRTGRAMHPRLLHQKLPNTQMNTH